MQVCDCEKQEKRENRSDLYLLALDGYFRVKAGLQTFTLRLRVLDLALVLANDWSVLTNRRLEVVVRKRRVAVFKLVLEDTSNPELKQPSYYTTVF